MVVLSSPGLLGENVRRPREKVDDRRELCLGRVLDAVNELIAERPDTAPEPPPIKDFRQLWSDINEIKAQSAVKRVERPLNDLAEMKKLHTEEFNQLAPKWGEILEE